MTHPPPIPESEIDLCLECFDFETVRKVMESIHWKYSTGNPPTYFQPNTVQLVITARRLLSAVANGCQRFESGGGFVALRETREDGSAYLVLEFVLRHTDTEYKQT